MPENAPPTEEFATALLGWFDVHGRKDLPWQHPRTPYRTWLSEVMLQQTQVRTVVGYFERFVEALPSLAALAGAPLDRVLALWSGLGYYSRARNLHRTACVCVEQHGGELPRDFDALAALPGIGRSTAAAILAQAFGQRHAILDGNVRRVLARWHGVRGWPGRTAVESALWKYAETHTPAVRVADYTQAIMDLGATVCVRSRPRCDACPLRRHCVALREGLTEELPEPKPSRTRPTRETTMLLVRDAHRRVLLERRPPTGVWARLWSLPEARDTDSARDVLHDRYAVSVESLLALGKFVHSFSHYHLRITPMLITGTSALRVADDGERGWFSREDLRVLGLPAPVRRLLEAAFDEERWAFEEERWQEPSIA
ncbi:MAG TPA: A/G-specific adenine glycosylase [Rhodanobacteraceae bacterium]|nr:A/G-specific adenine glycosylase [Rhodanobacteraceae bacterium]